MNEDAAGESAEDPRPVSRLSGAIDCRELADLVNDFGNAHHNFIMVGVEPPAFLLKVLYLPVVFLDFPLQVVDERGALGECIEDSLLPSSHTNKNAINTSNMFFTTLCESSRC